MDMVWKRAAALLLAMIALAAGLPAHGGADVPVEWAWDAEPFPEDADVLTLWVCPLIGADCMLLSFEGHFMLIDVGDRTTAKQVTAFLAEAGVERVDYVFSTHPHADHVGGIFSLVKSGFAIGAFITVFDHDYYEDRQVVIQREAIDAVEAVGIPVLDLHTGDTIPFGSATLTVYRLPDDRIDGTMNCNNQSAMLLVQAGDARLLLTADVEGRAQGILAELYNLDADILKFPHHGLSKANPAFLAEVDPALTFVTHGSANSKRAANQLTREGYTWITYASWGTLVLRTDGTRWTVEQRFTDSILKHAVKTYHLDGNKVRDWLTGN